MCAFLTCIIQCHLNDHDLAFSCKSLIRSSIGPSPFSPMFFRTFAKWFMAVLPSCDRERKKSQTRRQRGVPAMRQHRENMELMCVSGSTRRFTLSSAFTLALLSTSSFALSMPRLKERERRISNSFLEKRTLNRTNSGPSSSTRGPTSGTSRSLMHSGLGKQHLHDLVVFEAAHCHH